MNTNENKSVKLSFLQDACKRYESPSLTEGMATVDLFRICVYLCASLFICGQKECSPKRHQWLAIVYDPTASLANHQRFNHSATVTRLISTGTSTSGPMTVAKATGEASPKAAMATAMASSKLLLAAVKAMAVVRG